MPGSTDCRSPGVRQDHQDSRRAIGSLATSTKQRTWRKMPLAVGSLHGLGIRRRPPFAESPTRPGTPSRQRRRSSL